MAWSDGINGFLKGLGGAFNSFMIGLIVWGLIFLVCGYFVYRWYTKNKMFKYPVLLVGANNQIQILKAKIGKNKFHIPKLIIQGYEDPKYHLAVREPNAVFNGKNVRLIAFDGLGYLTYSDAFELKESDLSEEETESRREKFLNYAESLGISVKGVYIDKIGIEKNKYLETSLTPVERSEAVDAVMESAEKGSVMTSVTKWVFTMCIIFIVMSVIGVVMVAKYNVESAEVSSKAAIQLKEAGVILQETTASNIKSIDHNTLMLINFAKSLGQNITLEIGGK